MNQEKFRSTKLYHRYQYLQSFYNKHQKFLPVAFFFSGFGWDSLTLTRIDRMLDNLILFIYLLLAGGCILLIQFLENDVIHNKRILKYREWYPLALQFFLGGLFSGYVVFYFQSAAMTKSWIFFVMLLALLVANEFLEKRMNNLYLAAALYFITSFSFFIFFIPVISKTMNVFTFLLGAFLGLLLTLGCLFIIYKKLESFSQKKLVKVCLPVAFLFVFLIFFYFKNWIPPVPLSLKSGNIYHYVEKRQEKYVLKIEKPGLFHFWKKSDETFNYAEGDTVFCYTSIFAPTKLTKKCFHHWQKFSPEKREWVTTDRLGYEISGGRRGGYRGYTFKKNVSPGKWRVDVETEEEMLLGRISFKVKTAEKTEREYKTIFH